MVKVVVPPAATVSAGWVFTRHPPCRAPGPEDQAHGVGAQRQRAGAPVGNGENTLDDRILPALVQQRRIPEIGVIGRARARRAVGDVDPVAPTPRSRAPAASAPRRAAARYTTAPPARRSAELPPRRRKPTRRPAPRKKTGSDPIPCGSRYGLSSTVPRRPLLNPNSNTLAMPPSAWPGQTPARVEAPAPRICGQSIYIIFILYHYKYDINRRRRPSAFRSRTGVWFRRRGMDVKGAVLRPRLAQDREESGREPPRRRGTPRNTRFIDAGGPLAAEAPTDPPHGAGRPGRRSPAGA